MCSSAAARSLKCALQCCGTRRYRSTSRTTTRSICRRVPGYTSRLRHTTRCARVNSPRVCTARRRPTGTVRPDRTLFPSTACPAVWDRADPANCRLGNWRPSRSRRWPYLGTGPSTRPHSGKYLGKINFVFRPKIFNDMLNILNQILPASIGLKFYPFILDKPP
jgi:hypothetical protein